MNRSRLTRSPRTQVTVALFCAAAILAGCGGSSEEPNLPPPDEKKAEIAKARKELRKARQEQRQIRKQAREKTNTLRESSSSLNGFLGTLPGRAGAVVAPVGVHGPRFTGGSLGSGPAWSTIKVPIAQRVLADAGGPANLSQAQAGQIEAALTLSDNDAAAALFDSLVSTYGSVTEGSEAVGEMLGEAGDTQTVISTEGRDGFSTYGQTDWSLFEQNKYISALVGGCLADQQTTDYLLEQMSNVTSDTWGLGSTGVPAKWKGGWGPGTDGKYLVRQMGVVEIPGGNPMVITLAVIPSDGSYESGQAMASEIAAWAVENLGDEVSAAGGC